MATILWIDDDLDEAMEYLISRVLSKGADHKLVFVKDGADGLAIAKRIKPDLVISDIQMPGMNGFQVCQELKSDPTTKLVPIVLTSANSEYREEGFRMGADAFISRPIFRQELISVVNLTLKLNWPTEAALALRDEWQSRPTDDHFHQLEVELRDDAISPQRLEAIFRLFVALKQDRGLDILLRGNAQIALSLREEMLVAAGGIGNRCAVDILIDALYDAEKRIRRAAAESLGKIGDARALVPLGRCLYSDKSSAVQLAMIEALGRLKSPQAIQSLTDRLEYKNSSTLNIPIVQSLTEIGHNDCGEPLVKVALEKRFDVQTRCAALEALGQLGFQPAVEPLIMLLNQESDIAIRRSVIGSLGQLRDTRATPALIEVLTSDTHASLTLAAIRALAQLRDKQAILTLLGLLDSEKPLDQVEAAALALAEIETDEGSAHQLLWRLLGSEHNELKEAALYALTRLGDQCVIGPLIRFIKSNDERYHTKLIAALADQPWSERVVRVWIRALSARQVEDRGRAVVMLATLDKYAQLPNRTDARLVFCANVRHSLPSLQEPRAAYRRYAIFAQLMAALHLERASQNARLRDIGLSSAQPNVKAATLATLGQNQDSEAYGLFVEALKDAEVMVRRAAVESLGRLREDRAIPILAGMLQDTAPSVRFSATLALASINTFQAAEVLGQTLRSGSKDLRIDVAKALGKMSPEHSLDYLLDALATEEDTTVLCAIVDTLPDLKSPLAIPKLLPLLNHSEYYVRSSAQQAITALTKQSQAS